MGESTGIGPEELTDYATSDEEEFILPQIIEGRAYKPKPRLTNNVPLRKMKDAQRIMSLPRHIGNPFMKSQNAETINQAWLLRERQLRNDPAYYPRSICDDDSVFESSDTIAAREKAAREEAMIQALFCDESLEVYRETSEKELAKMDKQVKLLGKRLEREWDFIECEELEMERNLAAAAKRKKNQEEPAKKNSV